MIPLDPRNRHDALLRPFLLAADEPEAERCLELLLDEHAAPIIRRILGAENRQYPARDAPRHQHTEDVYGEVMLSLLARLRALRAAPLVGGMPDFAGYVAVATYNASYQLLRRLYPLRASLKNRLRYALEHHEALALWQSRAGPFLAGLADWRGQDKALSGARFKQQLAQPDELARVHLTGASANGLPLAELLGALFKLAGQPVVFSELVAVVAELRGVRDQPDVPVEEAYKLVQQRAGKQHSTAEMVELRELLRRAWAEICQLPLRQRTAYLLNFQEAQGHADITTFLLTRTASPEELAAALDISVAELGRLWSALPLSDTQIAARLGATRQQVISLRKSARARLRRRLGTIKLIVGTVAWLSAAASHVFSK